MTCLAHPAWRNQHLRRLARNPFPRLREKVAGGRKGENKNPAQTLFSKPSIYAAWHEIPSPTCGEGGRRPEGENKNPALTPLSKPSIYTAWHEIPSPACGGRWPEAGRGKIKNRHRHRSASPVFTPLDGASVYPAWRIYEDVAKNPARHNNTAFPHPLSS